MEVQQLPKNPGKGFCIVDKSGFALERRQPDAPYAISFIGNDDRSGVFSKIDRKFPEWWRRLILNQQRFGSKLPAFLKDPQNHVLGVEYVRQGDKDLARFRFVYAPDRTDEKNLVEETTTEMLLDPSHQWVALSLTSHRPSKRDSEMTFEYGDDEDGLPTLKKYHTSQKFVDGSGNLGEIWQNWEFTKFSRKPPPDSAFTLAEFGLPDLDRPITRATGPRYEFWLLGLAAIFAVIALVARARRAR